MIREQVLSGLTWENRTPIPELAGWPVEPTVGELLLVVEDSEVKLSWREQGFTGNRDCAFKLPARSLLLALQAACEDADQADREAFRKYSRERHEQLDRAWLDDEVVWARAKQRGEVPWTREQDRQMAQMWLEAEGHGIKHAGDLCDDHETAQVRARLLRLGCDPDRPGQMLPGVEVELEPPKPDAVGDPPISIAAIRFPNGHPDTGDDTGTGTETGTDTGAGDATSNGHGQ